MKKATLPLYTLLVIGWLACLQSADSLTFPALSSYYSGGNAANTTGTKLLKAGNTVVVMGPMASKKCGCTNAAIGVHGVITGGGNISWNAIQAIEVNHYNNMIACINW